MLEIWQFEKHVPWISHIFLLRAPKKRSLDSGARQGDVPSPGELGFWSHGSLPVTVGFNAQRISWLGWFGYPIFFWKPPNGGCTPPLHGHFLMGKMIVSYWNLRGSWCSRAVSIYIYFQWLLRPFSLFYWLNSSDLTGWPSRINDCLFIFVSWFSSSRSWW